MAAAPKKDDLKTRFEAAAAAAKQTKKKPDNATLLKLYSYYKQATEGDVAGRTSGRIRLRRRREVRRVDEAQGNERRRRDDELHQAGRPAQPRVAPFRAARFAGLPAAGCRAVPPLDLIS